jgi:broad specificity phosphatase PhoE
MIRHSNREKIISSKVNGLTANLTSEGIRNAKIFGRELKDKLDVDLDNIYTTFMKRCIDTGNLIDSEHHSQTVVYNYDMEKSLTELGYVNKSKMMEYLDYFDKMIEKDEMNYPLMFEVLSKRNVVNYKTCNEFALKLISRFYIPSRTNLIVAHDTTIAPLMHFLSETFKFSLTEEMIKPKPLCGFHFCIVGDLFIVDWINFDKGINVKNLI